MLVPRILMRNLEGRAYGSPDKTTVVWLEFVNAESDALSVALCVGVLC